MLYGLRGRHTLPRPLTTPWSAPSGHHLCTPFTIANQVKEAAAILVNEPAAAIATQTFAAHTAADIADEEMEATTHPSLFVQARAYLPLSYHSPSGTCSTTGINSPRRTPANALGRRRGSHTSIEGRKSDRALVVVLAHWLLDRLATLAHASWRGIPALLIDIGSFSPCLTWPLPCNHLTELPSPAFHTTRMTPSSPSPGGLSAIGSKKKPSAVPTPRVVHRPLSGRGTLAPLGDFQRRGHNP